MNRQLLFFLLVGSATVGIDALLYSSLLATGIHSIFCKGLGFISGTVFSFYANRAWTFAPKAKQPSQMLLFFLVYTFSLALNVSINALTLLFSGERQLSFLVATMVSASSNFAGMKWVVFKEKAI